MMDATQNNQPIMLIPRFMYGTKKAVLGRCKTIMRHLFKHGTLPPSFNADLIEAHSVEGNVLMEMETNQSAREHFHLYCLAQAFEDVGLPWWEAETLYHDCSLIIHAEGGNHPWSTLCLLCQGSMNWRDDSRQRQHLLEALLRHWPSISSIQDKMQYEGTAMRNLSHEDADGYALRATAYWLKVGQGAGFWYELRQAGITDEEIDAYRTLENETDNIEALLTEAIRRNRLKLDSLEADRAEGIS